MLDRDALLPERTRPLRRVEYDGLVAAGAFAAERVELLHGELVAMTPQGVPHAWIAAELAQRLVAQLVRLGADDRYAVRSHSPYVAADDSEPEPDVAVVPRLPASAGHPRRAHLIVEVSDSTLRKDRAIKAAIYAAAGVPEYWIVDVDGGAVEVHTRPDGARYTAITRAGPGDVLRPIELPGVAIAVADLAPA